MSGASFEQGEGRWQGSAEVYDGDGRFAGYGRDARAIRRSLDGRTVEVEVSFTGPFRLSGRYTITDFGHHRVYGGPLNYGYAEALGDGLIDANNYWPDIGLSQRLFLMVLPGGDTQLSLAMLSRGEKPAYTVVGEYSRGSGADPASAPGSTHDQSDDPDAAPASTGSAHDRSGSPPAGRRAALLNRPGGWSGELNLVSADGSPAGTTHYREQLEADDDGRAIVVSLAGTGFTDEAEVRLRTDGCHRWTGSADNPASQHQTEPARHSEDGGPDRERTRPGTEHDSADDDPSEGRSRADAVGSESLWGGRALSGSLLFNVGLRLWRREVARLDGSCKGVLHTWYRGGTRLGAAHGVLHFSPADSAVSDG